MIQTPEITIPEKHPDVIAFRAEQARRQEFMNSLGAKQTELAGAQQRYAERMQSLRRSRLESEADELLSGASSVRLSPEDLKDIERLEHEIEVIELALQKQKSTLDLCQGRFNTAVSEANTSTYVRIEKRYYRAIQEAAEAGEEEFRFFEALQQAGVTPMFRPMRLNQIGIVSDTQSAAAFHAREVREFCPQAAA